MAKVQFEAGTGRHFDGVNLLIGEGIYAEIEVPEGASEDYGYLTMKKALVRKLTEKGMEVPELWYDGQEQYLEADADVDAEVYIEIEEENDSDDDLSWLFD